MANLDDDIFINMVNKHSDEVNQQKSLVTDSGATDSYYSGARKSVNDKDNGKKLSPSSKNKNKVRNAAITALLIASLVLSAHAISKAVDKPNYVDSRISYYAMVMGTESREPDMQVEYAHGINQTTGREYNVSYAMGHLVNDIHDAGQIDEVELRSAILGAYKVINEPCRDQEFSELLKHLANDENLNSRYNFFKSGDIEGFLKALGYDNWHDYHMKERKSIKELAETMEVPLERNEFKGGKKNG